MSVIRWDRYHQEVLIEKVRERTCLWDIRHPDYRNTHKKQGLYEEVAAEVEQIRPGTSVDDVRKRWANLRCQFSENMRAGRIKPGEAAPSDKPRKLWCKEILMFLSDVTVPRSSKGRRNQQQQQQQQQFEVAQGAELQLQPTGHEQTGGLADGSMSAGELEEPEEEEEAGSRQAGDFSQCGSGCDGGAVSPESCCYTPVRATTVSGLGAVVQVPSFVGAPPGDPNSMKRGVKGPDCLEQLAAPIVCAAPLAAPALPPSLRPQDAIDKYALCVASELRQIRQPQQLVLAKWHIQNVLFQAQFGMLAGPPPPMTFSTGPAVASPYTQDTIVNWQHSPPITGLSTEPGDHKEASQQPGQPNQHRTSTAQQDFVRSLTTV